MKKIPTLFKRDPDDRKRLLPEVTPGCEWVLAGEGVPTRKYDGTCVRIFHAWVDGPEVGVKVRREVKPGKPVPDGFDEVDYDEVTGKRVGWMPYGTSGFREFILKALGENPSVDDWPEGTYELCGPKVNGNPEDLCEHMLIPHGRDVLPIALGPGLPSVTPGVAYQLLEELLTAVTWEGIVWHHPDGRMAKLKRRDFW